MCGQTGSCPNSCIVGGGGTHILVGGSLSSVAIRGVTFHRSKVTSVKISGNPTIRITMLDCYWRVSVYLRVLRMRIIAYFSLVSLREERKNKKMPRSCAPFSRRKLRIDGVVGGDVLRLCVPVHPPDRVANPRVQRAADRIKDRWLDEAFDLVQHGEEGDWAHVRRVLVLRSLGGTGGRSERFLGHVSEGDVASALFCKKGREKKGRLAMIVSMQDPTMSHLMWMFAHEDENLIVVINLLQVSQ